MKTTLGLCATIALALLITPAPAAAAGNPITIVQCFVTVPKAMSKLASGTQIDYINVTKKVATQVEFMVAYRNSAHNFRRTVTDSGTFAPAAQIQHHFDLYSDVTFGGKTVQSCAAIKVTFADGTVWNR